MTVGVAIIGSGFSGLGLGARLRRSGYEDFVILERAHEVGGTWRDNTYPGARCDTPSYLYSLSFAANPGWTNTYPSQPEIQAYLRGVADREDLRRFIRFGETVTDATWDVTEQLWRIRTNSGEVRARALAAGAGPLSGCFAGASPACSPRAVRRSSTCANCSSSVWATSRF